MKIFHISDLHFGMHQEAVLTSFLTDLTQIKPDVIIISGDSTQRATAEEYALFHSFLNKIQSKVLVVPGNHDIPLYNLVARLLYPFEKYNENVSESLSAEFENDCVRILGVNSVNPFRLKDGKLTSDTMHEIKQYFSAPFAGVSILFFHHNFDYMEGRHKPLENYETFLQYLKESNIDMVCTGHSHYADLSIIEKVDEHPCAILHAGTLLCTRKKDGLNSYYQMEIQEKHCKVDLRVFDEPGSFETITSFDLDLSKSFSIVHNLLIKHEAKRIR